MQIFVFIFSFLFQSNGQISTYSPEPSAIEAEGKLLYEKKCHLCHELKNINDYTIEKWDKILPKMARRAMVGKKKRKKIYAYIQWKLAN